MEEKEVARGSAPRPPDPAALTHKHAQAHTPRPFLTFQILFAQRGMLDSRQGQRFTFHSESELGLPLAGGEDGLPACGDKVASRDKAHQPAVPNASAGFSGHFSRRENRVFGGFQCLEPLRPKAQTDTSAKHLQGSDVWIPTHGGAPAREEEAPRTRAWRSCGCAAWQRFTKGQVRGQDGGERRVRNEGETEAVHRGAARLGDWSPTGNSRVKKTGIDLLGVGGAWIWP